MGVLARLTKSSVDLALRIQPRRTARVRDDILYAAPAERETVSEIREAGARLVAAGLAPTTLGMIAVRRNDATITRTIPGTDLRLIDNRFLESVGADDPHPAVAALQSAPAAVWGYPPYLLAMQDTQPIRQIGIEELRAVVGEIMLDPPLLGDGVCVLPGRGVVATGADPGEAVTRLEAAELLAKISYHQGGEHG